MSQKDGDISVSHGDRPRHPRPTLNHNDVIDKYPRTSDIHARPAVQEYSETLNSAGLKLYEYPLRHTGFKPISTIPLPSSNLLSQIKRYPRSVDNSNDEDLVSSLDDELISRTLSFVDKLQWTSEPCQSRNDRIIILKAAKFRPDQFFPVFAEEVNRTVQIANIINDLLLFTKSPPEDFMDVFFAMTQSLVEMGPQVRGCAIAFNLLNSGALSSSTPPPASAPSSESSPATAKSQTRYEPQSLFPYSYRTRDEAVVVTDLSMLYKPQTTTWFSVHVNRSTDGLLKPKNRIYANRTDMGNITSYKAKWNRTVAVTPEDGYWATPYYDCLLRSWIVQYSVPFYQLEGSTPEFKGVVLLEANFESIRINQCAEDGSLFSDTHRCRRTTTEVMRDFGWEAMSAHVRTATIFRCPAPQARPLMARMWKTHFNCLVMQTSAPSTHMGEEPIVTFDFLARGIPLGIQSFCMTISLVIAIVIVCLRKSKVMRSSIWVLLEMLLLGAVLLYATVVIQYFEPNTTTCLLLPWFREVGFVFVYGVLVLKIYRILAEFQSRKAHRVHVRDKDLLKYLAVMLTVVVAYMSAWTAVNIDHLDNNSTILERLHTPESGLSYTLCRSMWWDYVIETGEFIFLCFGIYICYCVRSAQTEFLEGRYITGAIIYEAIVSTVFYVLRHLWWYKLHPDYLFLMFFLRCQLTVTVVLLIILGPKIWYAHRPPDDDHARTRAYSQSDVQDSSSPETMKLNVGISSNGDVEVGEISLTEMDPEDIRAELKRLYTQLQIYKTKTMRKDNPHISKRRGGRKQTHRRFSLQAFHHKHRHHHDHEHEHEMSKTPEESTNSAEGMTFTTEPNVKEDASEGRSAPSVSFKSGHK
ncbi:unnamed protein product [Candidula unifasciata]|uniref:G-protein coupled receptors family 3 profile domain-containing protein n=1 Tax=Candidula unifasciata TaxID=100452 RepID=A0A8S3YTT1_9EUPU|nr:unnamed protein product [Candidula unifasciata]